MSVGRVDSEDADELPSAFADELEAGEPIQFRWDATDVHWATQWRSAPDETTFAATDRRVIFRNYEGTTSIGYEHVRAVEIDPARSGPDLSTAFVGCGALSMLVGLLVAARDFANGAGLVVLSVMLLVAGSAVRSDAGRETVTVVIDNERQRLSFATEEGVGAELSRLAARDAD